MTELPELMPLEWIEPKRLNSNVMRGEKYENTKRDIELHGIQEKLRLIPKDVYTGDPEQPHDRYVIEDGNQRYRIAQELGIEAVPYEIVERGELDSLAQNYRHQANRGEQDPLVEAEMFQHYLDQKLTQEQVVDVLGLKNRDELTHKIALLKLSEEVRDVMTDFPKVVEYRVRTRMYGEDEETVKELVDDIVQRCTITESHYRIIATLPDDGQMTVINAMLDAFIEGGTVSVRQVAESVKQIKERNERLKRFNVAWETAVVKNCPICAPEHNFPPLFTSWDEDNHTFSDALGHKWRYDKTPEEVAEEEEAERQRLEEEQRQREEDEARERRAQDTALIDNILLSHAEPPTHADLLREYYQLCPYRDFGEARKAVDHYLNNHPDVHLTQPPTPEELDQKRLEEEKARQQYLEDKLTRDTEHLDRITYLYRDDLTHKQLYNDYMELSRTVSGQDGRDVIALYLERHPEVKFPGDEPVKVRGIPGSVDREIEAALGQPPAPEEPPKKGKVYYTIKVEEFEKDAPVQQDGCRFGYSYDTGQGGGAGPIWDEESFPYTVDRMVKAIWEKSREMKSYPRPTMKNTVVEVCQAASDEGLITEAEIWNALITYQLNEAEDEAEEDQKGDEDIEEDEGRGIPESVDRETNEALGMPPMPEKKQEPPSITLIATPQELHERIVAWITLKLAELSDITSIHLEGLRDKEEVLIEYAEPDWKGRTSFGYRIQTTTPIDKHSRHVDSWKWLSFNAAQQQKGLKLTSGKLGTATPEDMDQISRFLNDTVYTDLDPWDDPNTVMGPTEFTMTPVDSKDEAVDEPTIPVPDHGRDYQEEAPVDLDAGEEHHEHYEVKEQPPEEEATEAEDLPTCPKCGKQSPNDNYCTHCGFFFNEDEPEPEEDVAHGLSENEEKWLATGVKKLGPLAHKLTLEEAQWLREHDTRKGAQNHLVNRISELKLANAPTPELQREADE